MDALEVVSNPLFIHSHAHSGRAVKNREGSFTSGPEVGVCSLVPREEEKWMAWLHGEGVHIEML